MLINKCDKKSKFIMFSSDLNYTKKSFIKYFSLVHFVIFVLLLNKIDVLSLTYKKVCSIKTYKDILMLTLK
jgi:hypothetical protein